MFQSQSLFTSEWFEGLNPSQKKAVMAEGIVRVIAAPGSGKTRTLTYRIAYLVKVKHYRPSSILALTFTRKAAMEMQQRLKKLIGSSVAKQVVCGTFHSFAFNVLKSEGIEFKLLQEQRRLSLIKHAINASGAQMGLKEASQFINLAKNNLRLLKDVEAEARISPVMAEKFAVYKFYEEAKRQDGLFDFDDLQIKLWQLFKKQPEVLEKYRCRFVHILVDEVQDINKVQFELLRLLTPPQNNLFVVGDDAQAIYRFRGAVPQYILEFDRYFPNTQTIKLEQNYRSTKHIVELSNRLMAHSALQLGKQIWTVNEEGTPPKVIAAANRDEEAFKVVKKIRELIRSGLEPQKIAVLYRTNYQSRPLEDNCIRFGVPYAVVGSTGFYLRKEVKDMTAYLRLMADFEDDEAFLQIFNVPPRDLAPIIPLLREKSIETGKSLFRCLPDIDYPNSQMRKRAERFYGIIKRANQLYTTGQFSLAEIVKEIRRLTSYDDYLRRKHQAVDESCLETLDEFCLSLMSFKDMGKFLAYLQVAQQEGRRQKGNRVNLLTIHKAKGLEWPVVFLVGCSPGILPHHRSADIEEERRLCYVAITRAQRQLFIAYAGRPSPFLREMLGR